MRVVTLLKFLPLLVALVLFLGMVRVAHVFRARAMRALADRWGFQYIGPTAPERWWLNRSHTKISPPVPAWFASWHPSGRRIRQVWDVIEGQQNGVSVLIFDCVIGEYRGGAACTVVACQTEQNPFGIVTSPDRVTQTHGWTILHGVWFLWFSWFMGTRHLDRYMRKLRVGSVG